MNRASLLELKEHMNKGGLASFDKKFEEILCKECSGKRSAAGQAFTKYICRICDTVQQHGNTNCPLICRNCSEGEGLCQRCMAVFDE